MDVLLSADECYLAWRWYCCRTMFWFAGAFWLCFGSYLPLHSEMWPCQQRNTYSSCWPYRGALPVTLQTPQLKLEKASFLCPTGNSFARGSMWPYQTRCWRRTIQGELDQQSNNSDCVHLIYVHIVAASLKSLLFTEIIFSMNCVHFCVFVKLMDADEWVQYHQEAKGAVLAHHIKFKTSCLPPF